MRLATLYKGLLQEGWILLHEETFIEDTPERTGVYFQLVKLNTSPDLPSRLHLGILLQTERKTGSYVMADMLAWPQANNLPLYPGAKQLETKWESHTTFDFPRLITTYLADTTKEQVFDYYLHKMVRDGWDFEGSSDFQIGFSFSAGPEQGIGGSAIIEVQPISGNQIKVLITTHGGELIDPQEVEAIPTSTLDALPCQPICLPTVVPNLLAR